MLTVLQTPLGPVPWVPRDFVLMPRNSPSPTRTRDGWLRGCTVHYSGGVLHWYYDAYMTDAIADEKVVMSAIRNHVARREPDGSITTSDVGYQALVGRSGIAWEGRGFDWMNAANGPLRPEVVSQYPPGTKVSNPWWQSIFLCVGIDPPYNNATPMQWETLRRLVALQVTQRQIVNPVVNGHRDVRQTLCPGSTIHSRLPQLLKGPVEMIANIRPKDCTTVLTLGLDGTVTWVEDDDIAQDLQTQYPGVVSAALIDNVSVRSLSVWRGRGAFPTYKPFGTSTVELTRDMFAEWID